MKQQEKAWTHDEIVEQYRSASSVIQRLQQLLAEEPDRQFSADELADALHTTRQQFAGALGAYSGYLYRHWGRYSWPFTMHRAPSTGHRSYSMGADVAAIIRSQQ